MNIVFLDIDGVCNFFGIENTARAPSGCLGINDKLVKRVAQIVKATNSFIVLTSTWKTEWHEIEDDCSEDAKYMQRKLNRQGLHINDKTTEPNGALDMRGHGILDWCAKHKVTNYVVLDDDTFADYDDEIMKHFVHTDGLVGITDQNVQEAIKILNTP